MGCRNHEGQARRDAAATLSRLRAAGLDTRIETTGGDASEHLRQLRPKVGLHTISNCNFPDPSRRGLHRVDSGSAGRNPGFADSAMEQAVPLSA